MYVRFTKDSHKPGTQQGFIVERVFCVWHFILLKTFFFIVCVSCERVEVRGQRAGIASHPPPCGFWGWNSACQAFRSKHLPAQPPTGLCLASNQVNHFLTYLTLLLFIVSFPDRSHAQGDQDMCLLLLNFQGPCVWHIELVDSLVVAAAR